VIRIASRGSDLALWQANWVRERLLAGQPGIEVGIEIIRTTGDRILDIPLSRIGERGLFTKEIDEAILAKRADIAVHSLKDVPTRIPEGLKIAAVSDREDPRDVLILRKGARETLATMPPGARIGTSSLRRRAQLAMLRADLEAVDIRGNLGTRLERLDRGDYDGIVLAAAGVLRLDWADRISEWLPSDHWLPAVGQGALAIISRDDDPILGERLRPIGHAPTTAATTAEREFLRRLEGGCQIPIGGLAQVAGDTLALHGMVASLDGQVVIRGSREGPVSMAAAIGISLGDDLADRGAEDLLDEIRRSTSAPYVPAP
jgi:hydroxymethylbilane synthase